MRYVIVCTIKGSAGEFNNNLRKDVFHKFGVKSSKLPAHFTIKAPFEHDDITELENILENFSKTYSKAPFQIDGYNFFRKDVIYMDVKMSNKAKNIHDKLIDELLTLPYLTFKPNEGKNKVFHITVASKRINGKFEAIKNYVESIPCNFEGSFDNIGIYKWVNNTWVLHKEYELLP
ncbi:MAG: 2'-5' RNA ligase family protein [Clostridium argentinense]|uniref:2'-5' RNA ligase family protein n=1 Tax=Clostridium faecium TaxID=2762223 RepID=A0ABR8YXF1_9CLOT|nr:2'-5' RNA ligase family protein [Clostridium faecium]MBD8048683.1 2'-5' RNA ligase family protein [Clostridium faecium]MBS5824493.1 2'-5' RNA ligase family protein [Clostridium argentinense]